MQLVRVMWSPLGCERRWRCLEQGQRPSSEGEVFAGGFGAAWLDEDLHGAVHQSVSARSLEQRRSRREGKGEGKR